MIARHILEESRSAVAAATASDPDRRLDRRRAMDAARSGSHPERLIAAADAGAVHRQEAAARIATRSTTRRRGARSRWCERCARSPDACIVASVSPMLASADRMIAAWRWPLAACDAAWRRRRRPSSPRSPAASGTPEIPGLKMVWLAPWGDRRTGAVAQHHRAPDRRPGRLGAQRRARAGEEPDPARRHHLGRNRRHGVLGGAGNRDHRPMATAPTATTTNTSTTSRPTARCSTSNSIGIEFAGNYPDVDDAAPPRLRSRPGAMLVRVLRARYDIPPERVYAHNWIDYKDARYCEGCELATLARDPDSDVRISRHSGARGRRPSEPGICGRQSVTCSGSGFARCYRCRAPE